MRKYPDQPERIENIISVLKTQDIDVKKAPDVDEKYIGRIHDKDYIAFLKSIPPDVDEVAPTALNMGGHIVRDSSFYSKLGHYFFDPATPLTSSSFKAAKNSVGTAIAVINDLENRSSSSFGLCRPPGHHATSRFGGGYCLFNNIAVAAQVLVDRGKSVSILDLDYHHGNGTQSIFFSTDKVQYISIHADPQANYPFYWGFADEQGEGLGMGYNHNVPVPHTISTEQYLDEVDKACTLVNDYQPDMVLVSMGFDTYVRDPLAGMNLDTEHYFVIGEKLSSFEKVGVLLEGGYNLYDLGNCFYSLYQGLMD